MSLVCAIWLFPVASALALMEPTDNSCPRTSLADTLGAESTQGSWSEFLFIHGAPCKVTTKNLAPCPEPDLGYVKG